MQKLLTKTKLILADIPYVFKRLPKSASLDILYHCQFMSADLVEKYINDKPSLSTDPRWKESGAETIKEYQMWTWSDCGIACFKMILGAIDKKYDTLTLVEIAKGAREYGAFEKDERMASGLHYAEFCNFVKERFNLKARVAKILTLNQIKDVVSRGNFVIISVHPSIRNLGGEEPAKKGGHPVLVVGYDDDMAGVYIHNPSGYQSNNSQDRAFVPYTKFKKFFANRGMTIGRR